MWKAQLQKAIREVRIINKPTSPHFHGLFRFIETKLPELRMLSPNTFYHISDIHDDFETGAKIHFVFGDGHDTIHEVDATDVSPEEWEEIFKEKVELGLTLPRGEHKNNAWRDIPLDVVEAYKYNEFDDDHF
mmetsp:Transcript_12213/g.18469  ORF Transcript_12213/g.18469 Transcript_12213/m.18469 type:complete len:132 (-) Transcript_12213:174-569(-)